MAAVSHTKDSLSRDEVERFSRQMLLPQIGTQGQLLLKKAKVLVVGAGGLGSPAALYLAAAGVGRLGIVDYDAVESSNLQRQVVHDEGRIGTSKAESARDAIQRKTSFTDCRAHNVVLNSDTALDLVSRYDIVLDASDNVATRYLISDACVLSNRPLVSGSALRFDGQVTVYNHNGGPCYRCIFPTPPPAESVTNCSEGGVLGAVTGIIGCIQALETIKVICGLEVSYSQKMLIFDGLSSSFRSIKLRQRRSDCSACGVSPSITKLIDYELFCGAKATDKAITRHELQPNERVSVAAYHELRKNSYPHLLLDVRDENHFDIARLEGAINIPWRKLPRRLGEVLDMVGVADGEVSDRTQDDLKPVYVLCRLGNDSQLAVRLLKSSGLTRVWDIEGGLHAWSDLVDPNFPQF
ncbi:hypothetical protein DFJ73DRAFT_857242 [Zopfochytrium polystomum]|nr:hypothetical protein DFJ73DRAFT_857242 [Zopfochytrium polystomum]